MIYSKDRKEQYWQSISLVINEVLAMIYSRESTTLNVRQFLKTAVRGLINARIHMFGGEACLWEILMYPNFITIKGETETYEFKNCCEINFSIEDPLTTINLPVSYADISQFLSDSNIMSIKRDSVAELVPIPDEECFDYGLLFSFFLYDGQALAVFFKVEPDADVMPSAKERGFAYTDLPENGKHALHMRDIADMAKKWDAEKVASGSLLEALRADNYVYIYINTAKSSPSFVVGNEVLHLGEADSMNILSFVQEAYRRVKIAAKE
jgi:hypothetical protein